jgi:predicted helicase
VKAIRWASDRIGPEGVVAFITNSSFLDQIAFDGLRKHLEQDFESIYILDLGGNVRKNAKLSGSTHNVFGIRIGVSINLLVRKERHPELKPANIYYARLGEYWRKEEKYLFLDNARDMSNVIWERIHPDRKKTWLTKGLREEFDDFLPIATREAKKSKNSDGTIFKTYSLGVATSRDEWVYDFAEPLLAEKIQVLIRNFNFEVARYIQEARKLNIDVFVNNNAAFMKWTDRLKAALAQRRTLTFKHEKFVRLLIVLS